MCPLYEFDFDYYNTKKMYFKDFVFNELVGKLLQLRLVLDEWLDINKLKCLSF